MDEKLNLAEQYYKNGYNCAQAVFCAFADELGLEEKAAYNLAEGFGGGFGGMQEVCGAFSGAAAVISYTIGKDKETGSSRGEVYKAVRNAGELFKNEYDSIRCKEILQGNAPKAFQCGMKVKDAVLIVQNILSQKNLSN
ncbi:MAG: C-GCAxxG-C-C family protein [Eubacterium sp.]|nr:C-GCAxxG-C-C family protein [Eubacterium sp.]